VIGRILLLGFALSTAAPQLALAARERVGSVDVFLVLDESGSMKPIFSKVTAFIADALVRDYLEPGDYLCVIGFSSEARIRVSQRLSSKEEKENLGELVRSLNVVPQGYTDLGRSLEETRKQLSRLSDPSHQQVVLVLTDGVNHPPRESPYFAPVKRDTGKGLPPTSDFNERFLAQVKSLSRQGYRTHVVGIGTVTDARKLGEALGAEHTVLKEFDSEELARALSRFWDDTIDLAGVNGPDAACLPGGEMALDVRLRSTSEQDREIHLGAISVRDLKRLAAGTISESLSASAAVAGEPRWALAARGDGNFPIRVALPADFPAGDFEATLRFEQRSAVKFYPPEASFRFHVPSFWERYGAALGGVAFAVALGAAGILSYRRRPIPVTMVVEGEAIPQSMRPVPFRIHGHSSIGGGASDRFRVTGLPQKVAVLERRSVDSFSLVSTRPELVPTLPEYTLGEAVEVRTAEGERKVVRFVRFQKKAAVARPRVVPTPKPTAGGGVDFR
jgi:Mg-chelatase subunit ChlD